MTTPYIPQEPGNPILAKDWNDMQTQIRDHITTHTHSGGENGVKLTGDGIDPGSNLQVSNVGTRTLNVANQATVRGQLVVQGQLLNTGPVLVKGGAITPEVGNHPGAGIQFPPDPGGGTGDDAFIRFFPVAGETTKLLIGVNNDPDDSIGLWQAGAERMTLWGGRVGVGTQTPQDLLHIKAPGGNIGLQIDTGPAPADIAAIRFSGNGAPRSWIGASPQSGRTWIGNFASAETLSVLNASVGVRRQTPARALQIGGDENGIGFDPSDVSPNAGYVRFGDNSGWKLHFGRSKEAPAAGLNNNLAGVLMTLQDNGNLGLGNPNPQARLDVVGGGLRVRGGAITPDVGDGPTAGIQFPNDPGGGGGDEAYLRYSVVAGETTRLALGTGNDPDDYIALTQFGRERLTVRAGGVNIDGSDNVNAQVTLKSYSRTIANTWSGRITAGGDQNVVVAGEWAGAAVIGAHNTALNAWTDLNINPSGSNRVNINTSTPEPGSTLTVQGATTIRCGGNGGWDRLVIAPSNEWGDPNATHITLGTGGPAGVMLSNPHITWRDGKSSIRYGRVNRTAGNTYWDAGVRSDASFSFIPYESGGDGSEKLKIQRSGEVLARNNVYVNTATNPLLFSAQWAGYTANGPQFAEISNDTNGYKCLMVVGNSSSGTRKVGVWDRLEVNGTMNVSSTATFGNWVNFGGNIGTRGYDANGGGIYPGGWGGGVHTWDIICEATIIYGNNCYKNSTLRVKENIRPLTGCLDIIDRLTPIKYDHREFSKSRDNFGFIAEEVRDVAPELVHAIDPGQPNFFAASLNQDSLTALALAGVQELARKVARLERQLAGADAPAAPAVRDAIEVLAEQTHARKDGALEDYVAVRFTAEVPQLGERQTVRYLRLPPDFDRHEYLMGELKRWKHALTA